MPKSLATSNCIIVGNGLIGRNTLTLTLTLVEQFYELTGIGSSIPKFIVAKKIASDKNVGLKSMDSFGF